MEDRNREFISREINARPAVHRTGAGFSRTRSGGYSVSGRRGRKQQRIHFSRLGVKSVICLLLVAGCLYLKFAETPFSKKAMAYISGVITYDMDFSQPFGELKFVENIFPGAQEVFGNGAKYPMPVDGAVTEKFGEDGSTGVRIAAKEAGQQVNACAAGKVTRRGTSSVYGNYLRIAQPDGMEATYYGLSESSYKEGDTVEQGAKIGTLAAKELYFEITKNTIPKDPMLYLVNKQP